MLRTQVLQEMDKKSWQFLAVTSPTAGCGKTVTACNLAMSIARLPERSVLLVDLDLRKPMVANYLGIGSANGGVLSVLEGARHFRRRSCRQVSVRTACWCCPDRSRRALRNGWPPRRWATLLQTIKRDFRSRIVIFDLPPMLLGDDVISSCREWMRRCLLRGSEARRFLTSRNARGICSEHRLSAWLSTRRQRRLVRITATIDFKSDCASEAA